MGRQLLQDFIDSTASFSVPLPQYLEESKINTSNLLVVHADSCIRQFYHEHIDWVCGGQWNELLQNIEKFVRAFRQSDIELVVFFDGSLNLTSLHNWSTKHRFFRDIVRETLSHVSNNQSIPFRTKAKNFVSPGSLKSAIRLAFRSLNVMVCCSLEDVYKESLLFAKDENCLGIIGSDANFFLCNAPRYISLGNVRWVKKIFSACKVYNFEAILKELNLRLVQLPYLAALLGNFMINDSNLSSFYWELIEEDHPLKKLQVNLIAEAVLPPPEVRLKCVAKFLHDNGDKVKDVNYLAKVVFSKAKSISIESGGKMLTSVIEYYEDCLKASSSSICTYVDKDDSGLSPAGFPSVHFLKDQPSLTRYKSTWKYVDKPKQQATTTAPEAPKPKEVGEETKAKDRVENPEEVIKQGTLEEAAQALIQLELNEANTVEKSGEEEKKEKAAGIMKNEVIARNIVANDEKPSIPNDETLPLISDCKSVEYSREIQLKGVSDDISDEVLQVARKRHQSGQMCPEILNLLTKGEIILDLALDDDVATTRLPIALIFRPLRQLVYGVLFGAKMEPSEIPAEEEIQENGILYDQKSSDEEDEKSSALEVVVNGEEKEPCKINGVETNDDVKIENNDICNTLLSVKEWCIHGEKELDEPDRVEPKGMTWGVPPLKKLWFGIESEDNANRLKAFLSCMKSDTVNMSNTAMVPQRLMLLCCVLRYLIQQKSGKAVLTKQDIDAFLAQALSTQLTIDHNAQNLANMKLTHIDSRCIQLAAIFMSGIENAIIANDACGSPVPWEFCCPWNFFDGKLFHSKWLLSTMNTSATDLCDGKPHLGEKLERLRWCITEGLNLKYNITGLANKKFSNPFGLQMNSSPFQGVLRPGGSYSPNQMRPRSRGAGSKRMVHGSGGTLHVAGVPIAHWHGNKAGIGYSKNAPGVLVGGPNSVDLPSSHRRGRGRGARLNRGRGLLQTPFISPWQQGYGFEEYVNNTYHRYMKGVQKGEQTRMKVSKSNRGQVFTSRTRNQQNTNNSGKAGDGNVTNWFGKGRGQIDKQTSSLSVKQAPTETYGRGQWINAS